MILPSLLSGIYVQFYIPSLANGAFLAICYGNLVLILLSNQNGKNSLDGQKLVSSCLLVPSLNYAWDKCGFQVETAVDILQTF